MFGPEVRVSVRVMFGCEVTVMKVREEMGTNNNKSSIPCHDKHDCQTCHDKHDCLVFIRSNRTQKYGIFILIIQKFTTIKIPSTSRIAESTAM